MTARLAFAIIFSVYLLIFTFHAVYVGKTVYGDGIYYYSWLRSVARDGDVDFTNEYKTLGGIQPLTASGLPGNKYSIGPALFWFPTYRLFPNQLAVGFTSVFYAITGLVLLYRLLTKSFSQTVSLLTILTTAFATNLFFYGSVDPVNSHALSFFTVALFLSFLFARKKSWFTIGLTLGLIGTVRPQDMIVGLLAQPAKWRQFFTGVIVGFMPQIIAWQWLYGNPLAFPYLTGGEGFSLSVSNVFGVLFAPSNGLFLWTPITLVGLIGLWKYKKFLLIFFLQLLIVGSWSTWWQGASYSGRMFVGMLPLLAFGIAEVLSKIRIPKLPLYLLVGSLSSINSLLILYFLITR